MLITLLGKVWDLKKHQSSSIYKLEVLMNNKTADKLYKVGRKILCVFTAYLIFLLGWMAYSIVRTWNNPAYGSEKLSVRIIDLVSVLWFDEIQLIIFILL